MLERVGIAIDILFSGVRLLWLSPMRPISCIFCLIAPFLAEVFFNALVDRLAQFVKTHERFGEYTHRIYKLLGME